MCVVGRAYCLEIIQGPMGATAFIGTRCPAHGWQTWDQMSVQPFVAVPTALEVHDSLYTSLLTFMERSTHKG